MKLSKYIQDAKINKDIGAQIKVARNHMKLSQAELMDRLGKNPPRVYRLENGSVKINAALLIRIADALRTPIRDFFFPYDRWGVPEVELPKDEKELLRIYRAAKAQGRLLGSSIDLSQFDPDYESLKSSPEKMELYRKKAEEEGKKQNARRLAQERAEQSIWKSPKK